MADRLLKQSLQHLVTALDPFFNPCFAMFPFRQYIRDPYTSQPSITQSLRVAVVTYVLIQYLRQAQLLRKPYNQWYIIHSFMDYLYFLGHTTDSISKFGFWPFNLREKKVTKQAFFTETPP
ncbi:MAG: hypothetical protein L0Y56_07410 [Nitrospira sp.]|nr:hypothetical protein [Nitrospira sp.]